MDILLFLFFILLLRFFIVILRFSFMPFSRFSCLCGKLSAFYIKMQNMAVFVCHAVFCG